jgi:predicted phosphodiesterase
MPNKLPLALLLLGLLVGCDEEQPAPKDNPESGDPALDGQAKLLRGPYLQSVSGGTVTVSWTTDVGATSRVHYWSDPKHVQVASGRTFVPTPSTDNSLLAGTLPLAFQHEVALPSLVPNEAYHYQVVSLPGPQPTAVFHAPPDESGDFSFFVFGDTRTNGDDHCQVIADMVPFVEADVNAAFVLHTGDMVETGGLEEEWDDFFEFEAPLLSRVPLLPVFGNHELFLGRTIFEGLFRQPPSSSGGTDRWYSVDVGNMHIAVLDAQSIGNEPQLAWLSEDLADSQAAVKVVALHKPLYTFSNHSPEVTLRESLLPILQKNHVALVVSGHNHLYERFFGDGIHFVVSGGGGAPLYGTHDDPEANNEGAELRAEAAVLHFVYGQRRGSQIRFETISSPDREVLDCWVIDPARPGVELPCQ